MREASAGRPITVFTAVAQPGSVARIRRTDHIMAFDKQIPTRILATGVRLELDPPNDDGSDTAVRAVCFVKIQCGSESERRERRVQYGQIPDRGDPASYLLGLARTQRDDNLGGLLGDLRQEGHDVTRFEFFAAPFAVELAPDLAERLHSRWDERPPRLS